MLFGFWICTSLLHVFLLCGWLSSLVQGNSFMKTPMGLPKIGSRRRSSQWKPHVSWVSCECFQGLKAVSANLTLLRTTKFLPCSRRYFSEAEKNNPADCSFTLKKSVLVWREIYHSVIDWFRLVSLTKTGNQAVFPSYKAPCSAQISHHFSIHSMVK